MERQVLRQRHRQDHKAHSVVNPAAGRGKLATVMASIERFFPGDRHETHILGSKVRTANILGDALDQGFNTIVPVGGDGTVSSVASALVGTRAEMGIMPFGTANICSPVSWEYPLGSKMLVI